MASVPLHYRHCGRGPAVLILHGLFGSSRNWQSVARRLAPGHSVHAVDLRNHGDSPHTGEMSYEAMARDVVALMDRLALIHATVIGHSMGGKAAMWLALDQPGRVSRLIAVDIAPVAYSDRFSGYIEAMRGLPLADLQSRTDADRRLQAAVPDTALRQFLLHNLAHQNGRYFWHVNLESIRRHLDAIVGFPDVNGAYRGPAHFIRGEHSDSVTPAHHGIIRRLFPAASIVTVPRAGHWPHAEQPEAFLSALAAALTEP